MATMRELKGRIASVRSSQKITGAMKMISSAKLRKAEQALSRALPYRTELQTILSRLYDPSFDLLYMPLLRQRPVEHVALVVFASDEGLCGSFNTSLYKKLAETVREYKKQNISTITIYAIGKKIAANVSNLADVTVVDTTYFQGIKNTAAHAYQLSEELMDRYTRKQIDRVEIIYYHMKNVGVQYLRNEVLLPVSIDVAQLPVRDGIIPDYIIEPDYAAVMEGLLPMCVKASLYEMLLDSRVSEQAARIMSMQLANENALKLMDKLQLEYNKLRQQNITSELLDILGGSVR